MLPISVIENSKIDRNWAPIGVQILSICVKGKYKIENQN